MNFKRKSSLKDVFEQLNQKPAAEVARVPAELCYRLQRAEIEHAASHKKLERELQAFAEKLRAEHEPVCEAHSSLKKKIWAEIFEAAGIAEEDREENYSIDVRTGALSIETDSFPEALERIFEGAANAFATRRGPLH
jgi:acetoin utilization deacetylase AcuC-like enzyme